MKTLYIDTHNDINIVLLNEDNIIREKKIIDQKENSTILMPTIIQVIGDNKIDQIIVINGPGYFTGVRLGVTIAKTLAYTKNIPIEETINTCKDIIKFCFTAKTGNTFLKTYHYVNNEPRIVNKVNRVVASKDESLGTLKKFKITDEGTPRYDKIAEIPEHCRLLNEELQMIDDLDKEWYVSFAKNKLKELLVI